MKIIICILVLTSLSYLYVNTTKINLKNSVLQYGYDNQNSLNYNFIYPSIKSFDHFSNQDLSSANHHSPLYLEINNKNLIIFTTRDSYLVLWDTEQRKIYKKTKLSGTEVNSTPIINSENKTILVKTIGDGSTQQIITTLDFEGNIISVKNINLSEAFNQKVKDFIPSKIHCKTSLSLLKKINNEAYLIFGCSIKTQVYNLDEELKLYGTHQGATGLVVASKIDSKEVLFYKSSLKTNIDYSGYDTGIYLSGGSIPTKGQYLYVATGNGPIDRFKNNGCSILKLAIKNKKIEVISRFVFSKFTSNECHSLNLDMTSSSPIFLGDHSAIVEKTGLLHIFDTKTMGKEYKKSLKISGLPHYSQGASYRLNNNDYFLTHWNNPYDEKIETYATVLESSLTTITRSGFTKEACLGSISKDEAQNYSLMYTGEFRDSFLSSPPFLYPYLLSSTHPPFLKKRLPFLYPVKNIWPKYSLIGIAGEKDKNNYEKEIEVGFYNFYERSVFLLGDSATIKKHINEVPIQTIRIKSSFSKKCTNKNRENIYLLKKVTTLEKGWGYKVFKFNKKKLELIHSHNFKNNFNPNKTSPTIINYKDRKAFLITGNKEGKSIAYLIDINFNILKEFNFEGESYFSRPLWTPNFLLLPTRDSGLQSFEIRH